MDPDAYRADSAQRWERAAEGWGRHRTDFDRAMMGVTQAMLDGARLQPGQHVLELAAGLGETGMMAAELVTPGGSVVISDGSEAMLELARARGEQVGATNVAFQLLEAEWIDLSAASVDVVLCRFGLMLVADPGTALGEVRRILRPGGRVVLAAWDIPAENPWTEIAAEVGAELGLSESRDPDAPGLFAFSASGRIEELLASAGFLDWSVESVAAEFVYDDLDAWWEQRVDLSPPFADLLAGLSGDDRDSFRSAIDARLAAYEVPDSGGQISLPARVLVATADA